MCLPVCAYVFVFTRSVFVYQTCLCLQDLFVFTRPVCVYRICLCLPNLFVFTRPVPDGVKISAISEEDVDVVNSTWKFSGAVTADFIRNQIMHSPSVILKSDSGEHIGHMLGETSGTIGILYVQPPFRGKGYAKVIISQLAHQYFDMGEDVYVFVEESNPVSLNLHRSLGFKVVPDLQLSWIECYPETKWVQPKMAPNSLKMNPFGSR